MENPKIVCIDEDDQQKRDDDEVFHEIIITSLLCYQLYYDLITVVLELRNASNSSKYKHSKKTI